MLLHLAQFNAYPAMPRSTDRGHLAAGLWESEIGNGYKFYPLGFAENLHLDS